MVPSLARATRCREAPSACDPGRSPRTRSEIARIVTALRDHEMPVDEIRAVVGTDDPVVLHRYFELHRERVQERLAERKLVLAGLERELPDACSRR